MKLYRLKSEIENLDLDKLEEEREEILDSFERVEFFFHEDHVFRVYIEDDGLVCTLQDTNLEIYPDHETEAEEKDAENLLKKLSDSLNELSSDIEFVEKDIDFYVELDELDLGQFITEEFKNKLEELGEDNLDLHLSRLVLAKVDEDDNSEGVEIGYRSPEDASKNKAVVRGNKSIIEEITRVFNAR